MIYNETYQQADPITIIKKEFEINGRTKVSETADNKLHTILKRAQRIK